MIRYNDLLMTADANNDDSGSEVFKNGKKQYDNLASVEIDSNQWRLTRFYWPGTATENTQGHWDKRIDVNMQDCSWVW